MAKEIYVATVQIALEAKSGADAVDGIGEILHGAQGNRHILDWAYLKVGSQRLLPTKRDVGSR